MTSTRNRILPMPTQVATRWASRRTFRADNIPSPEALCEAKREQHVTVSVAIPTRNDEDTIGRICRQVRTDLMSGTALVDELVVLDAGSDDKTGERARRAGGTVVAVDRVLPEIAPHSGKGDSLWRSLSILTGDVIVWIDPSIRPFDSRTVSGLVAPMLLDQTVGFVKGYHRADAEIDLEIDGVTYYAGRGSVCEVLVRPLLNILLPELGGFLEPTAGSYAGRSSVLRQVPFSSGEAIDVALLIDVVAAFGLDAVAQADLGLTAETSRPLEAVRSRAYAMAGAILKRAQEQKRIKLAPNALMHPLLVPQGPGVDCERVDQIERPPVEVLPPLLAALRNGSAPHSPAPSERERPVNGAPARAPRTFPSAASRWKCAAER